MENLHDFDTEAFIRDLENNPVDFPLDTAFLDPEFDFGNIGFAEGSYDYTLPSLSENEFLEEIQPSLDVPGLVPDSDGEPLLKMSQRLEELSEQVQALRDE